MKEQLISFETAKLAHEKGFRHRSDFMYDRNNEIQNTPSIKHLVNNGEIKEIARPTQIFAPTQSLLQKWLREKHEIFLNCITGYEYDTRFQLMYIDDGIDFDEQYTDMYDKYEDALEEALQLALKLIK